MLFERRSVGWAYLIAVLGTGLVLATFASTSGVMRTPIATFVFLLAVLAAGVAGGWKPGFLTTGLCSVGVIFFLLPPYYTFRVSKLTDVARLLAYIVAGLAISLLCESLKRAWARIEERQNRLVEEIAERRKAVEQLREADRRKDEFLATLAHELRNPLAPLSNAVQLWSLLENNAAEMAGLRLMMKRQLDQMTRLIDDLLDVSRINRGKISLRTTQVDLSTVVSEAIDSLKSLTELGGHRLSLTSPSERLSVQGDAIRLSQVFGNVLHNAIKFTPAGGLIAVNVERVGHDAVVTIRDTGCGIPEPMLARIFEMFQQVDQSLGRAHGGLGIGLTLVKRLVELHGGMIQAHSDGPGQGSEFAITLPALNAAGDRSDNPQTAGESPSRSKLPRQRILVVDDVQESAETLALLLRAIGQDVSTVHDGRSALAWAVEHKPDLIFLDIAMPGMDGYEVARRIRGTAGLEELVLVALTGYGQEDDRRRASEAGFNYHLTKPTSVEALSDVLSKRRNPLPAAALAPQMTSELGLRS
jgi:signal transduction histidine kinase/ActR/RegA family two-component response regulator